MSKEVEGIVSTVIALTVLFLAVFDPDTSMAIAISSLIGFGSYHLMTYKKSS